MKHPSFAALKFSLLLVLAALLMAGAGVWWTHSQDQAAEMALQQQRMKMNSARQQLDRSNQQKQLIATHLADYQALVARGFVGAENRLAWIEAAQLANREAGLYGLDYRLMPRAPSLPALAQGLPLGQTTMILSMPLLVETDLSHFLAALKARAPGLVRVQGCRVSQLTDAPFAAVNQPRLQAECTFTWFTVAEKTGRAS
jgi:hypothetical protein